MVVGTAHNREAGTVLVVLAKIMAAEGAGKEVIEAEAESIEVVVVVVAVADAKENIESSTIDGRSRVLLSETPCTIQLLLALFQNRNTVETSS